MKKILLLLVIVCLSAFAVGLFGCEHKHSFSVTTIAPTCTEKGYDSHTCECGYFFIDNFTDEIGHEFTEYTYNEDATCVANGTNTAPCNHAGCTATDTVIAEDTILGHSFEAYIYNNDATCERNGTKTAHCGHIGCSATDTVAAEGTKLEHNLSISEVIIGKSEHDVDRCGKFICNDCGAIEYKTITYQDVGIPIVNIDGDLSKATKSVNADITFSFEGDTVFENIAGTVKWQGSSSLDYPEKNYTLKLESKIKVVDDWGKQKKYCLKANYIDFSQGRNVVSAKLYGEIVKSRDYEDEVSKLVNGGAIDGFACVVYNNGVFHGIYTFNIPKDKWLFDMKDSDEKNQAILQCKSWSDSVFLKEPIADDFSNGWELEFYSNEESEIDNSSSWVVEKFNQFIYFLNNNNGDNFKNGISNYVNVDRCIDVLIYTAVIQGSDNLAKNILWITYDGGNTWQPSVYDLDSTWGCRWDGELFQNTNAYIDLSQSIGNMLFVRLYDNYHDKIVERYKELRSSILSDKNIINAFESFFVTIPQEYYKADAIKWPEKKNIETNNIVSIKIFLRAYIKRMDEVLG